MNDSIRTLPTILVVDDEPADLAVLAQLLEPLGRVRAVTSGKRALRALADPPSPDLILLDATMPDMDGYAVLRRLREQPGIRDIPVIFLTALGEEGNEELGLALGAVDYVTKPVRPTVVRARVLAHLELKVGRDRLRDQKIWLESEVQRRLTDTLLMQDVSLSALAGLAETRDSDTGNHILRTQAYVACLGQRLVRDPRYARDLGGGNLALIVKAAPLHDLGKIGIPDRILLKPGPLTPAEREVMTGHARIGGEAIMNAIAKVVANSGEAGSGCPQALAFLELAARIATHHHERWDGSGYPDRLAGTAIPLAARLMAVADVFDALTMERVYRQAMGVEEAARYIRDQRGTQFDPDLVDTFVAVEEEFAEIARRFADAGAHAVAALDLRATPD